MSKYIGSVKQRRNALKRRRRYLRQPWAREKESKRFREKNAWYKATIMGHYGGKCKRCGFDDLRALSIDHTEQNGKKHTTLNGRRYGGMALYRWLTRNKYPKGFRVLCLNCQFIVYFEHRARIRDMRNVKQR
jgi:hypothetical protein